MSTFVCRNSVWEQWNTGLYICFLWLLVIEIPSLDQTHRHSESMGSNGVYAKQNINYVILWTDSLLAPFIPLFVFSLSPFVTLFMARYFAIGTSVSGVCWCFQTYLMFEIYANERHELVQWYGNKINDRIFHDGLRAFGDVFNGDKTSLWPFEYNNSSSSKELKLTIIFYARSPCVDLFSFFLCLSSFQSEDTEFIKWWKKHLHFHFESGKIGIWSISRKMMQLRLKIDVPSKFMEYFR